MCELLIDSFIKENEATEINLFTSYQLIANIETNLQTVLMMHESISPRK